ncbi:hypothetical protein QX201_004220 [Fusarium graminearum]
MDPFVYVAFNSKDGKQRFLGPAFVGASQAEFEKAIAPGGSKRVSLEHTPGGDHISKDLLKFLETLKDKGKLLKPEEPATAFSVLVETGIPESLNGQTVYWKDIVNSGNL